MALQNAFEELATAAKQDAANALLAQIKAVLQAADSSGGATETTLAAVLSALTGAGIKLNASALSALESITATVSGPIDLSPATLAALESIQAAVAGTVALDGPTLAALESVTAAVTGTVDLSPATLAALESITVTVANPTAAPETGLAKDATVAALGTTVASEVTLRRMLKLLDFARTATDQLRVNVDSGTLSGLNSIAWGNAGVAPAPYATGAPTSMDAREQMKAAARSNVQQARTRWSFT